MSRGTPGPGVRAACRQALRAGRARHAPCLAAHGRAGAASQPLRWQGSPAASHGAPAPCGGLPAAGGAGARRAGHPRSERGLAAADRRPPGVVAGLRHRVARGGGAPVRRVHRRAMGTVQPHAAQRPGDAGDPGLAGLPQPREPAALPRPPGHPRVRAAAAHAGRRNRRNDFAGGRTAWPPWARSSSGAAARPAAAARRRRRALPGGPAAAPGGHAGGGRVPPGGGRAMAQPAADAPRVRAAG